MKEVINITIKDNQDNVILTTTSETYKTDIEQNRGKLNITWMCKVEYRSSKDYFSTPGADARRVVIYGDKALKADYNFGRCEVYMKNYADDLLSAFNEDFNG